MSTEPNRVEPAAAAPIGSPEQLIAAREARGWSLSEAASKLGMMPRQIDAIEHGRWEALPGHAFVRGAIRAYAKALQVDVAPLLSSLGAQTPAPELRPSASLEAPLPRRGALGFDNGGSGSRLTWILLGLLGVAAIAMYFGRGADLGRVLDSSGGAQPARTVESVPLSPQPRADGAAGSGNAAQPPATATSVPANTPGREAGAASSSASALSPAPAEVAVSRAGAAAGAGSALGSSSIAPASASAAPASAGVGGLPFASAADSAAGAVAVSGAGQGAAVNGAPTRAAADASVDALVFRFERESWVEVRDATGRVLLVGTQPAQSTREIAGRKPYSLTVGNAPHVRLEHAGKSVDLGAIAQKGVARLKIE